MDERKEAVKYAIPKYDKELDKWKLDVEADGKIYPVGHYIKGCEPFFECSTWDTAAAVDDYIEQSGGALVRKEGVNNGKNYL